LFADDDFPMQVIDTNHKNHSGALQMTTMKLGRHLLAVALIALGGTAHGATVYKLDSIVLNTGNASGNYNFGVGLLASSVCYSCGIDTVTDDGFGNLTVSQISYKLAGFGANFTNTFSGTATLGVGTSLLKDPGEICTVANTATQYCSPTDNRSYYGDWLTGFTADGVTPSLHAAFNAVASGNNLTLRVRKDLSLTPGANSWLQLSFNYSVVPVPAAVWLFGSALGVLGIARRRAAAA
jgi:hypothetical protein